MATDEQWEEFPIELHRYERYWMLQYDVLHRRGYILRERYKPTEVDDWLNGTIEVDPDEAERRGLLDFPHDPRSVQRGIDATRASDGAQIWIKRVVLSRLPDPALCTELQLNQLLLSDPFAGDPSNHCLPLLDHFTEQHPDNAATFGDVVFLVFPLGLRADAIPCRIALHALDLVYQTLEGLAFLQEHNIAHRDLQSLNFVVDPTDIMPEGRIHPMQNYVATLLGVEFPRPVHDRLTTPVKYFFIDLGESVRFEGERHAVSWFRSWYRLPEVHGSVDKSLPLPSNDIILSRPYDAFKADVHQLGQTFASMFGSSIPGTQQLFSAMTAPTPAERPTASECLATFRRNVARLHRWEMLLPVHDMSMQRLYALTDGYERKAAVLHWLDWVRIAIKGLFTRSPDVRTRFSC